MKLVSDWRRAWRWWSMRVLALLAVAPSVWVSLPPDLKSYVPAAWMPWIVSAVALGGMVGRVIKQGERGDE